MVFSMPPRLHKSRPTNSVKTDVMQVRGPFHPRATKSFSRGIPAYSHKIKRYSLTFSDILFQFIKPFMKIVLCCPFWTSSLLQKLRGGAEYSCLFYLATFHVVKFWQKQETASLHLESRSVMCNGAEEKQAHRCDPYGLRVQEQPLFLVCSSIVFYSYGSDVWNQFILPD